MTEPKQTYVQLLKALTGRTATSEHAAQLLTERFNTKSNKRETTLLLIDEVGKQINSDQ